MARRRHRRSPELTPLIDVLFILLFASLIQARSAVQDSRARAAEDRPTAADVEVTDAGPVDAGPVDAAPVDAGPTDAGPVDAAPPEQPESAYQARSRELATTMARGVYGRNALVVDIRSDAVVTGIDNWREKQKIGYWMFEHPLTVLDPDSGIRVRPRESGDPEHLCPFVRIAAHVEDDDEMLVFVVLEKPFDELELAVSRTLEDGLKDCFDTARGMVILMDPDDHAEGDAHGFE